MSSESALPGTFSRVVLKLSGETFCHARERGISMDEVVHTRGRLIRRRSAVWKLPL